MGSEFGGHEHSRVTHLNPRAVARDIYPHLQPSGLESRCVCFCSFKHACVYVCVYVCMCVQITLFRACIYVT